MSQADPTQAEPLIWTTKGNIPLASVKQEVEWRVMPDQVIFIERYTLDGEIVKESSHVRILSGVESEGISSL